MNRNKLSDNKIVSKLAASAIMLIGLLAVILLGLKHAADVRHGAVESGDLWLIDNYQVLMALTVGLVLLLGLLFYVGYRRKGSWKVINPELIFVPAVLGFGLIYLFVLPPLSAPDEVSHYISAYQLSGKMLGQETNYETGHVLVRMEDWFLEDMDQTYPYSVDAGGYLVVFGEDTEQAQVFGQTLDEETYRRIHEQGIWNSNKAWESEESKSGTTAWKKENGMAVSIYPPVVTTPLVYLPQAIGMAMARTFELSSLALVYLGRICNLLCFAGISYLAMRRLPFGKEVLFGVCLLPMTLHLAASLSYDAIIMAGIFLFTSWCLSLAYEKERVKVTDVLALAVIMAVIGPCKMVYAIFMGLCLLIPVKKFGGWKWWAASAAVVVGAWAVVMIVVNSQTIASYAVETESYVSWAGEAGYSLNLLLHNPRLLLKMFYNTIVWQAEYYHLTMIGAYLGNVDVVLDVPYLIIVLFTCGLLGLSLHKPGETMERREKHEESDLLLHATNHISGITSITGGRRIWVWVLCAGCTAALMLSMLIAWTPLSATVIAGVQGRYFLPFLPVLLMTFKNKLIVLTKNADRSILYLMCCANGYILLRLFSIVCLRL